MAVICRSDLEDVMEHKTLDQIRDVADILPDWLRTRPLSRRERLERWAEALEREDRGRLKTLFEIEYVPPAKLAALRADDSPLSVAFSDPRLRAEGLAGDTVGGDRLLRHQREATALDPLLLRPRRDDVGRRGGCARPPRRTALGRVEIFDAI
jgi:hypothetical protein